MMIEQKPQNNGLSTLFVHSSVKHILKKKI